MNINEWQKEIAGFLQTSPYIDTSALNNRTLLEMAFIVTFKRVSEINVVLKG